MYVYAPRSFNLHTCIIYIYMHTRPEFAYHVYMYTRGWLKVEVCMYIRAGG